MDLDTVGLGATGLEVSELALGTARFGDERDDGAEEVDRTTAHALLDEYAAAGGNFVDTADVYGDGRSEEYVGEWLANREREAFVVASKIYWPTREDDPNASGLNRKHLRHQLDRILDRLRTEYLDLLYVHRWDETTPTREFVYTLDEFVRDGRVHYLGASTREPNAWRVARANAIARHEGYEPFTNTQIAFNLLDRRAEPEYLPMVEERGLGLMAFSPLAGGFLTGKYDRGSSPPAGSRADREPQFRESYFTDERFDALETVREVATERDVSTLQVALAWVLAHPTVTAPVIGPRTTDQLAENLDAATMDLEDEVFERLAAVAPPGY